VISNYSFWLYRIFLTSVLSGFVAEVFAQAPGGLTRPVAVPVTVPGAYTSPTINYIRTWYPSMPTSNPAVVTSSTGVDTVRQSTQYFDGLGRLLQTVDKGMTPSGKDQVGPLLYDAYGREQYKYLPYAGSMGDGKFKTDPFNAQKAFYQDTLQNPGASGEAIYYSQTEYESSPLNRALRLYAPGNTWAKNDPLGLEKGGNKPIEQQYLLNTIADSVHIWDMPSNGNIVPTSSASRIYGTNKLYKNVTRDERGKRVIEYKSMDGQVVLKKTELSDIAQEGHVGWLCTYYVYDDVGNLRCVIPPNAVELIRLNWVIDATTARELCFFYRYDGRNRRTMKKVPGADSTEMVYDLRDRLVCSRDGNMRNATDKKWLVTFYDGLNRPTMTALYSSAATRDALQTSMNQTSSNTQTITHTIPEQADLEFAYYDGRAKYIARKSITFDGGFDTGVGGATDALIDSTAKQDTFSIEAVNPLPTITASALTPLTYTFYDDYSYTGKHNVVTGDLTNPTFSGSSYAEIISTTSNITRGLVTGTKVRVLGTDQWLTTTTYYTDKGRVQQIISDNVSGGKDVVSSIYDFSGKLLRTMHRHTNLRSGLTHETRIMTQMLYDAAGRVTEVIKKLNDSAQLTIAQSTYDELGQLKTKRLHVKDGTQLETLNYEYSIRSWLKSINKGYVNTPISYTSWFGQELSYDYGFTTNQVNGNISGIKWKGRSDGKGRAYGYTYDNANRLTKADFNQNNEAGSKTWDKTQQDYSVDQLVYDPNGNILSMRQKGMNGTSIQTIDSLKYGYQLNSNKMSFVTDRKNNTASQLGDFKEINNNETVDYTYDFIGNLVKDLNKNIDTIRYNHLNLPDSIVIKSKGSIRYLYDATGNKLRKIVADNTTSTAKITTTDYIGGFVYRNDTLELIGHEEGRIRPVYVAGQPVRYFYDYFLKDHLGNVRTVLTDQKSLSVYTATMEAANAPTEAALFSNVEETRTEKPVGYPEDQTAGSNQYVAKLNAKDGKKIGPALVLKVMAGDTIQIGARAFYKSNGPKDNKSVSPEDMVAGLLQAFGGGISGDASHGNRQVDRVLPFGNFNGSDYQRLKERDADQNQQDKPKAYLNFVLFDDQFNLVEENSGVRQVKGEPDELQTLTVDKMPVTKSGFLYVYTSNETEQDMLFDNVTVLAVSGPLLEETHYYPFGLTMAGISSSALRGTNYQENRKKFNGNELQSKEFSDGSGLELYDFNARTYDQQIGRFLRIDPATELAYDLTGYRFGFNNPVLHNDPSGLWEGTYRPGDVGFNEIFNSLKNGTFNINANTSEGSKGSSNDKNNKPLKLKVSEGRNNMGLWDQIKGFVSGSEATFEVPEMSGTFTWLIDGDGYITLDDYRIYNESNFGSGVRFLRLLAQARTAARMGEFVRESMFIKNARLKEILEFFYRADATIGNGSSAAALIYEAETGVLLSKTGHLQKVAEVRNTLVKLLNTSANQLTKFEKQFIVRQILESNRAMRIATGPNSIYSAPITQTIIQLMAKFPL